MSALERGALGEAELLAAVLAGLSFRYPEGVGADPHAVPGGGLAAEIVLPTGDRYAIAVRWMGDREGAA